jgi:hypothetical protein
MNSNFGNHKNTTKYSVAALSSLEYQKVFGYYYDNMVYSPLSRVAVEKFRSSSVQIDPSVEKDKELMQTLIDSLYSNFIEAPIRETMNDCLPQVSFTTKKSSTSYSSSLPMSMSKPSIVDENKRNNSSIIVQFKKSINYLKRRSCTIVSSRPGEKTVMEEALEHYKRIFSTHAPGFGNPNPILYYYY